SSKQLLLFEGHKNHVRDVRFSPDGMTIASSAHDQTIRIWNAETGTQLLVFPFDTGIGAIQFSEDGRQILMDIQEGVHGRSSWQRLPSGEGRTGGGAQMWELESQSQIAKFWFTMGVLAASYDADAKRVIVALDDGTARIVDTDTGQEILVL